MGEVSTEVSCLAVTRWIWNSNSVAHPTPTCCFCEWYGLTSTEMMLSSLDSKKMSLDFSAAYSLLKKKRFLSSQISWTSILPGSCHWLAFLSCQRTLKSRRQRYWTLPGRKEMKEIFPEIWMPTLSLTDYSTVNSPLEWWNDIWNGLFNQCLAFHHDLVLCYHYLKTALLLRF